MVLIVNYFKIQLAAHISNFFHQRVMGCGLFVACLDHDQLEINRRLAACGIRAVPGCNMTAAATSRIRI